MKTTPAPHIPTPAATTLPSTTSPNGYRLRVSDDRYVELRGNFLWYVVTAAGRIVSKPFESETEAVRSVKS